MRTTLIVLLAALTAALAVPAFAELQNVEVGGAIRIRGNWYSEGSIGPSFDDVQGNDLAFVEQRTLINVKADFTDNVTAFIELDSYNVFGDNFRGAGLGTGQVDGTPAGGGTSEPVVLLGIDNENETEIAFYQGYIQIREAWGTPINFTLGRQEIKLGSEWLVGNNDTAAFFRGLSFDAMIVTYTADNFWVGGGWARLAQSNNALGGRFEERGDTDLYAIFGTYTGFEDMSVDLYWIFAVQDQTDSLALIGTVEDARIHTIGSRFAGTHNQFDWDIEGALQFGSTGFAGVDQDAYAATGELGYTFDVKKQPRLFVKGSFFSGDDTDAPFNRLFSDHELSEFLGNTDLTNLWTIRGGISAQITEQLNLSATVAYFQVNEDFGTGVNAIGTEVGLYATYNYSEDLYFEAGYAHFFTDSDMQIGALVAANGFALIGGGGPGADEDLDYLYIETGISF